jgi:tRNA pseudouridine32 synthase/23S rRNA pseudouridine746 synthase
MLQGLNVEKPESGKHLEPTLIYEDEWLAVVAKPAEMLSVEGRCEKWSVEQWAREKFTEAQRVMPVHRLDMSTSGVLVVAKSLDAYRALQGEFNACRVAKKYIALLEGDIMIDEGRIELPLAADYANRPCQKVDFESGKPAITEYRVLERREGRTLVEFSPLTGRTHQLRLHAAHAEGLNAPIVGDALYGNRDRRLFLHAAYIAFTHPATGEWVEFNSPCDF